jgi:hypothetical protein
MVQNLNSRGQPAHDAMNMVNSGSFANTAANVNASMFATTSHLP